MVPAEGGWHGLSMQISSVKPETPGKPTREGAKRRLSFYRLQERPMCLKLQRGFPQILELGSRRKLPEATPMHNALGKGPTCRQVSGWKQGYENRGAGLGFGSEVLGTSERYDRPGLPSEDRQGPGAGSVPDPNHGRHREASNSSRHWISVFPCGRGALSQMTISCVTEIPPSALKADVERLISSEWSWFLAFRDNASLLISPGFLFRN